MPTPMLVDERAPVPVRERIGALLSRSIRADVAVARIRLVALDLTEGEVGGVERCRVLLGRLDAGMLLEAAEAGPPDAADRLHVLLTFAGSGRLEVRAAGMASWVPDFSIYRLRRETPIALLGAHFFGAPYPLVGPSFTAIVEDPSMVASMRERFDELWDFGHDVLPAITGVLERAHAMAVGGRARGGGRDRPGARR